MNLSGTSFDREAAAARRPRALAAPVDVLVAEALAVASFVRSYWRATYDGNHMTQPGLERAGNGLAPEIADEITSLAQLVRDAHMNAEQLEERQAHDANDDAAPIPAAALKARAREAIRELHEALRWALRGDPAQATLKAAKKPKSYPAFAMRLSELLSAAEKCRKQLDRVPSFEPDIITHAEEVIVELQARKSKTGKARTERAERYRRRNQFIAILQKRVNLVRDASRFVFRNHPNILRLVTSAHERERRKKNREKR